MVLNCGIHEAYIMRNATVPIKNTIHQCLRHQAFKRRISRMGNPTSDITAIAINVKIAPIIG